MITLSEFVTHYFAARSVTNGYRVNVARRVAKLEAFAGANDIEAVLSYDQVNGFLRQLDRSPVTVRSYRTDFLSLWNYAADRNLVPYPIARRIFRPETPELLVECYTLEEVRAILGAARLLRGSYPNGVGKARYWLGAISLAWDSGIRRGDVWRFRRDAVRPDGTFSQVQGKTGNVVRARLRASTIAALDAIGLPQPCRWTLDPSFFGRHFRKLVKAAGVNRGSFKFLRRASGSYVEAQQPGAGHKHLGHSNASVFDKFYDAKLGGHTLPMPPEL